MVDEKIDPSTNDLAYENYDEATVSGIDQVKQNIGIRLRMVKGEYFGDYTLGNIDFQALASKNNTVDMIDAATKATIQDTPEVVSLTFYASAFNPNTRVMNIVYSVQTIYGAIANQGISI